MCIFIFYDLSELKTENLMKSHTSKRGEGMGGAGLVQQFFQHLEGGYNLI